MSKGRRQRKNSAPKTGYRRRKVRESNGLLEKVLNKPLKQNQVVEMREEIALRAAANKKQQSDGFSQMYVRTTLAPKTVPTPATWEAIDQAYLTLHSTAPGSLTHFLLEAHQAGFRLFSSAGEATQYRAEAALADAEGNFRMATESLPCKALTLAGMYSMVRTGVRGKGEATDESVLAGRIVAGLTGRLPSQLKEDDPAWPLAKDCAAEICATFDTWKAMTRDPLTCGSLLNQVFATYSAKVDFTSAFKALMTVSETVPKAFEKATLIYDPGFEPMGIEASGDIIVALAARYAHEAHAKGVSEKSYVKTSVTSTNANGLGWLFNKGIKLLLAEEESELRKGLGVPATSKGKAALARLQAAAQQLKLPDIFTDNSLNTARVAVQGSLDSALSNHMGRLTSSLEALESIDDEALAALTPAIEHAAKQTDSGLPGLSSLAQRWETLLSTTPAAIAACQYLLGRTDDAVTESGIMGAIDTYSGYLQHVKGVKGTLGRINGAVKRGSMPGDEIKVPAGFDQLIELPTIKPPLQSVTADRERLIKETVELHKHYSDTMARLDDAYGLSFDKSLATREAYFRDMSKQSKIKALSDSRMVAYRDVLARLCSTVYRGSEALREAFWSMWKDHPVIQHAAKHRRKEWREHLWHRRHYVFVSPLDTRNKKLLWLDHNHIGTLDVVALCEDLLATDALDTRDQLQLRLCRDTILLMALPGEIKTALIDKQWVREQGGDELTALLDADSIERSAAQMLIQSAYRSGLSGAMYRLNKTEFRHTRTFKHLLGPRLIYVARDQHWKVPPQMLEGRFEELLSKDHMVWVEPGVLDSRATAAAISQGFAKLPAHLQTDALLFLRDLPHRWYVQAGVRDWGFSLPGVLIDNGTVSPQKSYSGLVPLRVGRQNTYWVKALNNQFTGGKTSPPQLQFERTFRVDEDGELIEDKAKRFVMFQFPVTERTLASESAVWEPRHILGIDPGSHGVGLAVMDHNGEIVDKGYVSVPSLQAYISTVEGHRKTTVPRQQYKAPYSNHLEKAKMAAAGDICHIVDRLVAEFDAAPIFEALGDGKDAHTQVWESVLQRYVWGDNDSQNSARTQHWRGAERWETPYLRVVPGEKKPKPLKLYPGSRVGSYGNSYTCPSCQRNAIEEIKTLMKSTKTAAISGGSLNLGTLALSLYGADPETFAERKKRHFHPKWVPLRDMTFKGLSPSSREGKELLGLVRRSIRRPHQSRHTKQSIESVFHCPYSDCGAVTNADAAAAVATGRKFISQIEKSA